MFSPNHWFQERDYLASFVNGIRAQLHNSFCLGVCRKPFIEFVLDWLKRFLRKDYCWLHAEV